MPGDHLKYYMRFLNKNSTTTFDFGNLVDSNDIHVTINSVSEGNSTTQNETLNLKNGVLTSSDGNQSRFLFVAAVPIDPSKLSTAGLSEQTAPVNGFNRLVYEGSQKNSTDTFDIKIDKETGILLDIDISNTGDLLGEPVTTRLLTKLLDTNIINSSNAGNGNANSLAIPQWIKNVARWWSQGQVGDDEFVQGMQYLVQQGIIKISPTTPSSTTPQIPQWIRSDAGWWADGQISDEQFIKGIQYLADVGIIHISS